MKIIETLQQKTTGIRDRHAFKILGFSIAVITVFTILCWAESLSVSLLTAPQKPVPRFRMGGIRKSIFDSRWIQLFPHLKAMVKVVTDGNQLSITSAGKSSITFLNAGQLSVGGTMKAVIVSRNDAGQRKTYGGDFYYVILRRPGSDSDGVTCEVTDNRNGSYDVSCIMPWSGTALAEAVLVHPSESIYQLMKRYSSEKEFGIHQKTTMLNSKNQTETTACSVGFPDKRPHEICDYTNPTHGEKRTCLITPSGECPKTILYQKKVIERQPPETRNDRLYCNKDNCLKEISGSGSKITIPQSKKVEAASSLIAGNLSIISLDPMVPSGWLQGGKWHSFKTDQSFGHNIKTLKTCLSNRRLHFFGDSTARNLYKYLTQSLRMKDQGLDNTVVWSQGRDAISVALNMTIQYKSHGPPLNNPGPEDSHPYMSDSFDAIRVGGNGTIVVFTIGYHFHYFDPDVYLRRLETIKQAVISLLTRLPGARVIVKGLHYHWQEKFRRSPWLTYRFLTILRHEFQGVRGVFYAEHWDYTLLRNNAGVHPNRAIFLGTFDILMTHLCLL